MKRTQFILALSLLILPLPGAASLPPNFSKDRDLKTCALDRHKTVSLDRLIRRLADKYVLAETTAHDAPERFNKVRTFVRAALARLRELHGDNCVDLYVNGRKDSALRPIID